jgi:hypothetical protein
VTAPWTLGEVFVLRHAGFPFEWLEQLGYSPAVLAAADRVIAAERSGKPASEASEALARVIADEFPELQARLHRFASTPDVQEAVHLSSPAMYDNMWVRYVERGPGKRNAHARRIERQVYTYLQRFCAKNETTSFFGPMGYGEVVAGAGFEVVVAPSPGRRKAFLASWATREIARVIAADPAVRPTLPMRRNPFVSIDGDRARCEALRIDDVVAPEELRILELASRPRPLAELAIELGRPPDEVVRCARALESRKLLMSGLALAADEGDALGVLTREVSALPAGPARDRWLGELAQLRAWLDEFAQPGLAERRKLLTQLEERFSSITGVPARHSAGKVYADRLVLYEEAESRFSIRIGRELFERIAADIAAALELSAVHGERVQAGHRSLVERLLTDTAGKCDLLTYTTRFRPDGEIRTGPPRLDAGAALSHTAELSGPATGGRYALPDLCLCASSPGAIARGEAAIVFARVHHHLLVRGWLDTWHPRPDEFDRAARDWLAREPDAASLVPLVIRRRNKGYYAFPGNEAIALGGDTTRATAVAPSRFEVRVGANGPELVDREGKRRELYLMLDDLSNYPPFAALAHPQVLHAVFRSEDGRSPRVQVGAATYQRARWEVRLPDLEGLPDHELLLKIRRIVTAQGWPRFVFARTDSERKPILIDTASPFSFDVLRHMVRGDELVRIDEMLPGPDELWLRDERGRYTCELRTQAVRWSRPPSSRAQAPTTRPKEK